MNPVWLKFLPNFLKNKIQNRTNLLKIISNIGWLFYGHAIQITVGLFMAIWMARYLGPEEYGTYNYAISLITLAAALPKLGLDNIIMRDIVQYKNQKYTILGTSFSLMLIVGVLTLLLTFILVPYIHPDNTKLQYVIFAISFVLTCQAANVIEFWFKAQVEARYAVHARNISILVITITRVILIITKAPLIAFAWAYSLEYAILALCFFIAYRISGEEVSRWEANLQQSKVLLKDSSPLFLAYLSCLLYTKVDQIMIGNMIDHYSVGLYAVSTKIFNLPTVLIYMINQSVFNQLVTSYKTNRDQFFKDYTKITNYFTVLAFVIVITLIALAESIIGTLFGQFYVDAVSILNVQVFGLLFMFNAGLRSSYLTISSNQNIILITTVFSAFLNVIINYILIPLYGTTGAAIATVITQAFSLFILNIMFKESRKLFFIQLKSFWIYNTIKDLINGINT